MEFIDYVCSKILKNYDYTQNYLSSSGMWEIPAKWYQMCSTLTLTRHELDILHNFSWHPCRAPMLACSQNLFPTYKDPLIHNKNVAHNNIFA